MAENTFDAQQAAEDAVLEKADANYAHPYDMPDKNAVPRDEYEHPYDMPAKRGAISEDAEHPYSVQPAADIQVQPEEYAADDDIAAGTAANRKADIYDIYDFEEDDDDQYEEDEAAAEDSSLIHEDAALNEQEPAVDGEDEPEHPWSLPAGAPEPEEDDREHPYS